jgi:DNA-binding transcriptional ArsR family regulator
MNELALTTESIPPAAVVGSTATPRGVSTSVFFQMLADPTRVRILELLEGDERNVGELVAALGVQQGRVSSHLACLRWCGFVATRRAGKFVYYRIADPRVGALIHLAHQLIADHGGEISTCACGVSSELGALSRPHPSTMGLCPGTPERGSE